MPPRAQPNKGAKSGLKPGKSPRAPLNAADRKRPVEEEDVFGGAERVKDKRVRSPNTKP